MGLSDLVLHLQIFAAILGAISSSDACERVDELCMFQHELQHVRSYSQNKFETHVEP